MEPHTSLPAPKETDLWYARQEVFTLSSLTLLPKDLLCSLTRLFSLPFSLQ